jgi:hypothetical protein
MNRKDPEMTTLDLTGRHEGTRHLMRTLRPNPNLGGIALDISVAALEHAVQMVSLLGDGPELTAGLRKLREAKDTFVIQALLDFNAIPSLT